MDLARYVVDVVVLKGRIVELRKSLEDAGFDAGAATIHYHLGKELSDPPSVTTIWRVL